MKRPIIWETHECSICLRPYKWPQGQDLPHSRTCGDFECIWTARRRDILSSKGPRLSPREELAQAEKGE